MERPFLWTISGLELVILVLLQHSRLLSSTTVSCLNLGALSAALFLCVLSENVGDVSLFELTRVDNDILCALLCRMSVGSESKLDLHQTSIMTLCLCQQQWRGTLNL